MWAQQKTPTFKYITHRYLTNNHNENILNQWTVIKIKIVQRKCTTQLTILPLYFQDYPLLSFFFCFTVKGKGKVFTIVF